MKRQQFFHDMPSKRHCLAPQAMQGPWERQYQVNSWPSNGAQLQGHLPRRPVEQPYYYHSNNIHNNIGNNSINNGISNSINNGITHNINAFPPNNSFYGFMGGSPPMQHNPIQHPPVQYPPIQYTPVQYTPQQFTLQRPEGIIRNPCIEFGNSSIDNNILPSCIPPIHNNSFGTNYLELVEWSMSQCYPVPQPPSPPGTTPQLWGPQQIFRAVDMPGTSADINRAHSTLIGGNIPNKVPIELPKCYAPGPCIRAVRGKPPESQDAYGLDLTTIGRLEPADESKKASIIRPVGEKRRQPLSEPHKSQNSQEPGKEKTDSPETGSPSQSDPKDNPPQPNSEDNLPHPNPENSSPEPDPEDNSPQSGVDYGLFGELGAIAKWLDEGKQCEAWIGEEQKEKEREEEERRAHNLQELNNLTEYPTECYSHLALRTP